MHEYRLNFYYDHIGGGKEIYVCYVERVRGAESESVFECDAQIGSRNYVSLYRHKTRDEIVVTQSGGADAVSRDGGDTWESFEGPVSEIEYSLIGEDVAGGIAGAW